MHQLQVYELQLLKEEEPQQVREHLDICGPAQPDRRSKLGVRDIRPVTGHHVRRQELVSRRGAVLQVGAESQGVAVRADRHGRVPRSRGVWTVQAEVQRGHQNVHSPDPHARQGARLCGRCHDSGCDVLHV